MNKNYILGSLAVAAIGLFAFKSTNNGKVEVYTNKVHMFSSGGQSGLTGAPGEANCTQCHTGTVQDGSVENQVTVVDAALSPVTTYIPGATYTVSVQLTSNPNKKGFSATILDLTDTKAGAMVGSGIGGTQDFAVGAREYVSHTSVSNTGAIWAWSWTAPATDVGDIIIYVASNVTNDDGATSGDIIYTSQTVLGSTASVSTLNAQEYSFNAGYSIESNSVSIDFNSLNSGNMFFNLVDMNGKSVFSYEMGNASIGENKELIALPDYIENGMYVVNYFVGNRSMSAKIMVQK